MGLRKLFMFELANGVTILRESCKMTDKKDNVLKLDLQMFAEELPKEETVVEETPPVDEPVTLTQEELNKKIEAEADRKLDIVLKKKTQEFQNKLSEEVKKAEERAKSYAQMTEEQRKSAEEEEERKLFEAEKAEFYRQKLELDIESDLISRSMPKSLAKVLVLLDDKEQISNVVTELEATWKEELNNELKKTVAQKSPYEGSLSRGKEVNPLAKAANERKKEKAVGPNPWG